MDARTQALLTDIRARFRHAYPSPPFPETDVDVWYQMEGTRLSDVLRLDPRTTFGRVLEGHENEVPWAELRQSGRSWGVQAGIGYGWRVATYPIRVGSNASAANIAQALIHEIEAERREFSDEHGYDALELPPLAALPRGGHALAANAINPISRDNRPNRNRDVYIASEVGNRTNSNRTGRIKHFYDYDDLKRVTVSPMTREPIDFNHDVRRVP